MARLLIPILFFLALGSDIAMSQVLHLSPAGSDQHDGRKPDQAFASLQRAVDAGYEASRKTGNSNSHILILVAEGHYKGQTTIADSPPAGTHLEIRAASPTGTAPTFDGTGTAGTWFVLKGATRKGARVTFRGLDIRNYRTAISLNGNRDNVNTFLTGTTIEDMTFDTIGQVAAPKSPPSTAAIRLVNARQNSIRNNRFVNIRNFKSCGNLHAIYLAHHASSNVIEDNDFENTCGSPIRIRDSSNNNIASNNTFRQADYPAIFDEWYCDRSKNPRCTKQSGECPSWGNIYSGNTVERSHAKAMSRPVLVHAPQIRAGCAAPDAAGRRPQAPR